MKLYHHQLTGVEFLASRRSAGLFDDQGLGKTITAAVAARRLNGRTLVVCPSSVQLNWRKEFLRWTDVTRVQVIDRGSVQLDTEAQVVIVTKDLLRTDAIAEQLSVPYRRHANRLQGGAAGSGADKKTWAVCIVDEAHFFKSPKAQRTKRLYGKPAGVGGRIEPSVRGACERVWLLTGTPMPNNPSELWVHLRHGAPERILNDKGRPMSFTEFKRRYCDIVSIPAPHGMVEKVVGARNVQELRERLTGWSLRRMKDKVLDLPPVRWSTVPVKAPAPMLEGYEDGMSLEAIRELDGFSTWRRACGVAKAPEAARLIAEELEDNTESLVVFFHHKEVHDILAEKLASLGTVSITGSVSGAKRQAAVEAFQAGEKRVALCNLVAGGTGTTLTRAARMMFVEQSFVPGENWQAADRINRIGQERSMLIRVLYADGTVDEPIADAITTKTQMIKEVLR